MPRYSDNSGEPNTCPLIDEVINAINNIEWSEDEDDISNELVTILERVRKINSNLRDWGNSLYRQVEELEDNVKCYESQIESLNIEHDRLLKSITDLQNQLEEISNLH